MGLLGALGKIGKGMLKVGSFLPIPGANYMGKAADALDAVGDVAGAGAKAQQNDRMSEAQLQTRMNEGNNRAALEAGTFNAGREGSLIRRALAARMMGDLKAPTDPRARFGGGVSNMSPDTLAAMQKYGAMADADVMSGGYKLTPTMSSIPTSGAMEKILGGVGTGAGILSALRKIGGGGRPSAQQVGGGMGGSTGAPNLPYQPLPRELPPLPAGQWAGGMPMPSGDPRLLPRPKPAGPVFPPLSDVRFKNFDELSGVNF